MSDPEINASDQGNIPIRKAYLGDLRHSTGAEQERYASHFTWKRPDGTVETAAAPEHEINASDQGNIPIRKAYLEDLRHSTGAEQERYASHFTWKRPDGTIETAAAPEHEINAGDQGKIPIRKVYLEDLRHSSGAEQERYASHFTWKRPDGAIETTAAPIASRAGKDSHFSLRPALDTTAVGILRSTLLPSLGLQSGLAVIAYGGSRLSDRVEGKDWLWPSSQIINAWWSLVGSRVLNENINISTAWSSLVYPEKLILGGVTLWGGSLLYRIVSRSVQGEDTKYKLDKTEPDFWNKAFFTTFLPVAGFQSLISLPFILPFRATGANGPAPVAGGFSDLAHGLGVFLFSTGFALEILADKELAKNEEKSSEGVWNISERPK